jgi:hypothetical protein
MLRHRLAALALVMVIVGAGVFSTARGQGRPDSAKLLASQRKAMLALAFMDGVWRGPAWTIVPSGQRHNVTQTERIGPFLDGAVKVIEGRGYDPDGSVTYNAFATISYDDSKSAYTMRSYAQGMVGDFEIKLTKEGYEWEIPAGPMTIRYTATVKDGTWKEVGDRISPGKEPVRFFEMNLTRVGDTDWPAAGAISPK